MESEDESEDESEEEGTEEAAVVAPRGRLSLPLSDAIGGGASGSGSDRWGKGERRSPDSPPQDLYELAAYTRREREKFEVLAEAHSQRMRELMTQSVPLSPSTSAGGASLAASPMMLPAFSLPGTGRAAAATAGRWGIPAGEGKPPSLHDRLADVQKHFEEHRLQWSTQQNA